MTNMAQSVPQRITFYNLGEGGMPRSPLAKSREASSHHPTFKFPNYSLPPPCENVWMKPCIMCWSTMVPLLVITLLPDLLEAL